MDNLPPDTTPPSIPTTSPATPISSDDKLWSIFCHLSLLFGVGFILPLIVYLIKKQDSPVTAENAKEALNFHISVYLYLFISFLLCFLFIGFLLLPVIGIASLVLAIVACLKVSEGVTYRYPMTIRLVE